MSKRHPKPLVIDMLHCVEKIMEYTDGMSFEAFVADSKTRDAVIRNIQVLGEAANRIPESFRSQYPEIEWTKIIRSRHIVSHQYDDIDDSTIWKIKVIYLPVLKLSLEKILKTL
jgi:uncharacterized protein with HEPN domain